MRRSVFMVCKEEDQMTGSSYVRSDSDKFLVLMQKANDRFRMEEGYSMQYV